MMCQQADSIRELADASHRLSTACIAAEFDRMRGRTLREIWDRTVNEPVPDELSNVLKRISEADQCSDQSAPISTAPRSPG